MAAKDAPLPRRGADIVRLEPIRAGEGLWRHRTTKLVFRVRPDQVRRDFSKR